MITDSADEVERQLNGPNGLQAGVHSPTTAIIGTVVPPARLSALSDRVIVQTAGRLRLVDAPLNGPRSAAVRGELSISVGTTPSRFSQVEPVLALLGQCVRVGGLGTAQVAHACRQLVSAATAIGMSEATMIAERAGLDTAALWISRGQPLPRDTTPDLTAGVLLAPLLSRPMRRTAVGFRPAWWTNFGAWPIRWRRLGSTARISVRRTGSWPPSSSQVSCRITITKTMITRMPMIVPISPRFIVPPLVTGSLQATT